MNPAPPSPDFSASGYHDEPLPLPVRGTRLAVTAVLVGVIFTVVIATYLRIEQQLQLTLEQRLTAVLSEQAHATKHWLRTRERIVKRAATLEGVQAFVRSLNESVSDGSLPREGLLDSIAPLHNAGLFSEMYLFKPDAREIITRFPETADKIAISSDAMGELKASGHAIDVIHSRGEGRILSLARVGTGESDSAILVFATESDSMTEGLKTEQNHGTETYAFDAAGLLEDREKNAKGTSRIPPGALKIAKGDAEQEGEPHHVDEYQGPGGAPVVGAWVWLDDYDLGLATEIAREEAYGSVALLRQSFLVLVVLVGAAVLGFIALGRWTLRVREESLLMTRRLSRLARAIQPLSAALEHDPSAVLLIDNEGSVVYANAASHRVLGVSRPLLGMDVDGVFERLPVELQSALASGQDSIVAQGAEFEDETLLVSSRSLRIDGNAHHLYMLRPVTQQVRRQEVEHWKKLIRVLSHELNNALAPITSLLSSAKTVNQMTHQDPRLGSIFESIAERTTHLVSFLEGYKEVARLPRPALRETSWEGFLVGLESQKKFRRKGEVPKEPGFFDPVQLERVVVNVLNNAYEAGSPADDIEVQVTEEAEGFRMDIMDRGTGMPEPVLKQAMLPFFSTKRTGTGVGLALSREIIEAHGGQLTLANREGGGLVVSCFLPNAPAPSRGSLNLMRALVPPGDASTTESSATTLANGDQNGTPPNDHDGETDQRSAPNEVDAQTARSTESSDSST